MKIQGFGKFLTEKRKAKDITLRRMAELLDISPAYLSDIEKSRRNPPLNMLEDMAKVLQLSDEEKDNMYDLAGEDRDEISPDLPDYIKDKPIVRAALRKASRKNVSDEEWEEFIKKLDEE